MEFLRELNDAQRAAVTSLDGPHMIIAGAGSGKTRVLTYRLAFILNQGLADPFECLALTFTNKAAKEMKARIEKLYGPEARNLFMGTFHSIFARMLRVEAEKLGYTSQFTIFDSDDSLSIIKNIIKEMKLDDKKNKPKVVQNYISSAKNNLIDPIEYAQNYITDTFTSVVARVYERYNIRLFDSNAMDFDDLLLKPLELFDRYPEILYKYQNRFKFIMVDEYQDTNHAQYLITKKLAAVHLNICVVGDDAQSIYSFRGATIQNILNFKKDYPEVKVYKLEQNYRSTKTIVEAANGIISKNKHQIQKNVYTQNEDGELIRIIEGASEQDEARQIVDQVREQKMRQNFQNHDFAILYRTNAQSRALETEFRRAGISYKIFGGLSFYRRKEIKDVIAYLKLTVNPKDEAALRRIINYPTRGIGQATIDKIRVFADAIGINFWEGIQRVRETGLAARAVNAVEGFVLKIQNYGVMAKSMNAYDVASHVAKDTGILKELHQENSIESLSRWENVQELLNAAKDFSEDADNDAHTLDAFLAEISLFTDQDEEIENPDFVTLMTIHSAKGLEYPSIFVTGMEEELFPNFMSMQSRAELEEERRLFYVATTRAKTQLTLTYAKCRYKYGSLQYNEPSRFLSEIDEEFLQWPTTSVPASAAPQRQAQQRMPENKNLRPLKRVINTTAGPAFDGDDLANLVTGMEVVHQRFGQGKVVGMEGNGTDRKATVFFKTKGQKVLLLKYAKLKIMN